MADICALVKGNSVYFRLSTSKDVKSTQNSTQNSEMKWLRESINCSIFFIIFLQQFLNLTAVLKTARIEEIPFNLGDNERAKLNRENSVSGKSSSGIHAITNIERQRGFLHLFHIPYILCFYAAKGKWPFIPTIMEGRVDAAAKSLFSHDDGFIKQFCRKWVQIKECFRPIFGNGTTTTNIEPLSKIKDCPCPTDGPQVFFDRDHIGKVSADTILNTIEFLESFLPTPTKRPKKRKNKVRSRIDEMDVE